MTRFLIVVHLVGCTLNVDADIDGNADVDGKANGNANGDGGDGGGAAVDATGQWTGSCDWSFTMTTTYSGYTYSYPYSLVFSLTLDLADAAGDISGNGSIDAGYGAYAATIEGFRDGADVSLDLEDSDGVFYAYDGVLSGDSMDGTFTIAPNGTSGYGPYPAPCTLDR